MTLKASVKYQLSDMRNACIIFWAIFLACVVLMGISVIGSNNMTQINVNGSEIAPMLFLLVAGMNSFSEIFRFFLQNGVTRKKLFVGRIISAGVISLVMAVMICFVNAAFQIAAQYYQNLQVETLYGATYAGRGAGILQSVWEFFMLGFLGMYFMLALGYLIATVFYRLGKAGKAIFAAGLPVFVFFLLPILMSTFWDTPAVRMVKSAAAVFFEWMAKSPYYAALVLLFCSAVCSALSWLLMRKAPFKEA